MLFISLGKLREKPTKEMTARIDRLVEKMSKDGVKFISGYWTLGRYDSVVIFEATDEKAAMKVNIMVSDIVKTETLVAVPRKDAVKLVE